VKTWTNEECGRWLDKWLAKAGFIVGKDVPTAADYYALTRTAWPRLGGAAGRLRWKQLDVRLMRAKTISPSQSPAAPA